MSKKTKTKKLIGGKKLTLISPKKTISGMIGSFIFSTIPIFIIYFFEILKLVNLEKIQFSVKALFLSLILSAACQLGDITLSYYKRKYKVKNFSNVLPGHGGLFDRIDSLTASAPVFFLAYSLLI